MRSNTLASTFPDFDFSAVHWYCQHIKGGYLVCAMSSSGIEGESMIDELTWKILTPRGKQLLLKATIAMAASNLIDQSKEQNHDRPET